MTALAIASTFAAGTAYAGALWFVAVQTARRRALALGALPAWVLGLCGSLAAGTAVFAPAVALPAGVALIGAIICGLVDARTGFIFDALTLNIAVATGVVMMVDGRLVDGAVGVAIVGGALALLYFATGRHGIGLGDVKLGSVIALGYGLESALVAIGSAFILGALYAGALMGLGRAQRTDALRFGPFIAGGAVLALTAGALGWRW